MGFRIYVDESGTHSDQWFLIGMLFVPDHGPLHSDLCAAKEHLNYFNRSPKRKCRYRELHLSEFRSDRDVQVAAKWIDLFVKHGCYFRSIIIDWSIWKGSYFGNPFDPQALLKRRAYKKWAEMLLHPELKTPRDGRPIYHAKLYMDKLRVLYGYDVLDHLRQRFLQNYAGHSPYIEEFQHTDSWRDANQCLQLCDLLTGCLYQSLVPSASDHKAAARAYLERSLRPFGVASMSAGFWKQYDPKTLTRHFSKFSAWFWRPARRKKQRRRRR